MLLRRLLLVTLLFSLPLIFSRLGSFSISKSSSHKNEALFPPVNSKELPADHKITMEQIFDGNHNWTNNIPIERKRIIVTTGDVIPARSVNFQATKFNNFKWPYEKTADILRNADITFVNLETALIKDCPLVTDGFKFCGSDKNIEGLLYSGVDVVSLANNHAENYGLDAVSYTDALLNKNGILATGLDGPVYKDVRGLKFAFLGYNDIGYEQLGVSWADEAEISSDILETKRNADIIIVAFHWGVEYQNQPDNRQKFFGHFAIDAGADLVIGNHPHWIQPVEIYKGKLITYAHGNFIFDQEWSLKTKQGVVGRYTFYDNQLVDIEFLPIQIESYGQPYFLNGVGKTTILDEMKKGSLELKSSQP